MPTRKDKKIKVNTKVIKQIKDAVQIYGQSVSSAAKSVGLSSATASNIKRSGYSLKRYRELARGKTNSVKKMTTPLTQEQKIIQLLDTNVALVKVVKQLAEENINLMEGIKDLNKSIKKLVNFLEKEEEEKSRRFRLF